MVKLIISFVFSFLSFMETEAQNTTFTTTLFRAVNYTQAQEDSIAATMTGQRFGFSLIFNTTLELPRLWNGSAFVNAPAIAISAINKAQGVQFT